MNARRRHFVWTWLLIIAIAALTGWVGPRTTAAAEFDQLNTALKLVPEDAAFYSAMMRNREQLEAILGSNAWAKLREMPVVQMGLMFYNMQLSTPESGPAKLQAALENPETRKILDMLADMASDEMFVYGDQSCVEFLGMVQEAAGAMRYGPALMQLAEAAGGDSPENPQAAALISTLADQDELAVPNMVFGFRLKNAELAKEFAAFGFRRGLLHDHHVFGDRLKRLENAAHVAVGGVGKGVAQREALQGQRRRRLVRGGLQMLAHAHQDVVEARCAGDARVRRKLRKVAHHDRKLAGRFDVRRIRGLIVLAHEFDGIERRNIRGGRGRREREIGRNAHEGTNAHDFALADTHGGRDAHHLARKHVLGEHVDAVALAVRIDRAVVVGLRRDANDFGSGGGAVIAIERRINRAAHEAAACNCGDYGRGQPAHGDGATIDRLLVMAIDAKRRLITEVDFGSKGLVPVACRSSVIHDRVLLPSGLPRRPSPGPRLPSWSCRLLEFRCANILTRIKISNTPPSWHEDDAASLTYRI